MNRQILRLAVPAILNNITVPLLGLSDTAITGHLGRDAYLAAMAVGSTMFGVIFMLCGFLRMGTTGLTANANGAGDEEMGRSVLRKALWIAALISVAVILFQGYIGSLLIRLIGASMEVSEPASLYFGIVVWSVPAQLGVTTISGWLIGKKNTVIPMIVSIGINVINIASSVLFVFALHYGFRGVAFGTFTANWLGLAAMLVFMRSEFRKARIATAETARHDAGLPRREAGRVKWSTFFKINSNLFFRSACIMGVSLSMTAIGASISEATLAANSVILQFFLFFSYFMDGLAFAGEALVGNSAGACDFKLLRSVVRHLVGWGAALAVTFSLAYFLLGSQIIALLSDSESVRETAARIRGWLVMLPAVTVWAFIFDGVFIGLTRTRPLLVVTLAGVILFFIVVKVLGPYLSWSPNSVLWCAFESYLLARGVLLAAKYLILQRKLINFVV